jgi:hypothetical protein
MLSFTQNYPDRDYRTLFNPHVGGHDQELIPPSKTFYRGVRVAVDDCDSIERAQELADFGNSLKVENKTYMNVPQGTYQSTEVRACLGVLNCLARKSNSDYQSLVIKF